MLANHGVQLAGVVDDTLLASYVLESHLTHNMDDLAERHLGVSTVSYEALCGKGAPKQIGFDEVDIDAAGHYAAEDADITLRLAHAFARNCTARWKTSIAASNCPPPRCCSPWSAPAC